MDALTWSSGRHTHQAVINVRPTAGRAANAIKSQPAVRIHCTPFSAGAEVLTFRAPRAHERDQR